VEGEVIAADPGRVTDDGKLQPMSVSEVKLDEEKYLIMHEGDILAILG
jgi:co-chaperonin GroES (HSP10)